MTVIAGLDLSLRASGAAVVNTTSNVWVTDLLKGKPLTQDASFVDRIDRLADMRQQVTAFIDPCDFVVIEGLSFASKGNARDQLAGLFWSVLSWVRDEADGMAIVPPMTRAKYATGNGASGKSDVLAAVRAEWPDVDVADHNVADAVTMAALGARFLGSPVDVDKPWRDQVGVI